MPDIINIDDLKQALQDFADKRDWNQFHSPKNLTMALAGEAAELLEIFQWMTEQNSLIAHHDKTLKEKTSHELADIMLYAIRIASVMEININQAINDKININEKKYPEEMVKGNSKKYSDY